MSVPTHLEGKRIGNNRIKLVSLLGAGSYGAVYRAILHRSGIKKPKYCAVKVLRSDLGEHDLWCQRRELELHSRVSQGDGVVTLYESFTEGNYRYIVMKFCPDGDLWFGINKKRYRGNDILIKNIFTQVLEAIEYCHSHSVYHRDIKPENILLCDGGSRALLADFGLATSDSVTTEIRSGSPFYMSPECWGYDSWNQPYATAPNDVWSLGILLINLACGRHAPWTHAHLNDHFFRDFVKHPKLFRLFIPLSPEAHDLLARVFVLNPGSRISIKDLKAAIKNITHFCIPSMRLKEYRNYQRAVWKATFTSPSPPRPLTLQAVPTQASRTDNAEAIQAIPLTTHIPVSVPTTNDALQINPIHWLPDLPPSSTSTSSVDSGGPVTPDMLPSVPSVEVPDFILPVTACPPSVAPKLCDQLSTPINSWQSILDAIDAL